MTTIREYQFIVGAETETLPAAGEPTDGNDLVTLGYVSDNFVPGGQPVNDIPGLQAIGSDDRDDGDTRLVKSSNTFYRFDSASAASADGVRIVQPSVGSGRWFRVRPGETASNGDYSVAGTISIGGDANITGDVTVTGDATINGTLTAINSTTLEVADANITINKGGNQASADLQDAGLTVEMSDATHAKIGFNSTLASKFMAGPVGSESEIITAANTQLMTGDKGFDLALRMKELAATPSTPASGYQKFYAKNDGKFYKLNSGAVETEIGSGGGSGGDGINYIGNPNAESDTNGWATYADASQSTPVDGTGGTADITFTRSTSSPLRGSASFLLTKVAGDQRGEGVAYAFTIDSADVSKSLQISFDYDSTDANYDANDIGIYIYDVTNSVLITPAAVNLPKAKTQFQTTFVASTSTSYRLIFHVATTETAAYSVKFDSVKVGPQLLTQGIADSDWQSYTLTVGASTTAPTLGTVVVNQARWARKGQNMLIMYTLSQSSAGTAGSGTYRFPLPSGYTIDSSVVNIDANGTNATNLGNAWMNRVGGPLDASGYVVPLTSTNLGLIVDGTADPIGSSPQGAFDAALQLKFLAVVPIAQWASSSVYLGTAQPEYLWSTATATAAGATATTGFGYGPQGVAFNAINSTTDGSFTTYRVQTLTPIQPTDQFQLQFTRDGVNWPQVGDDPAVEKPNVQGAKNYGMSYVRVAGSNNLVDIFFYNNGRQASGLTYASNGSPWSDISALGFRWRLVKIPGQVQVATPDINRLTPALFTFNTWNPTDVAGTETDANSVSSDVGQQDITISGISSGTVTVTFKTSGIYEINMPVSHKNGANYSTSRLRFTYGGTAQVFNVAEFESRLVVPGGANNANYSGSDFFRVDADAGETLTIRGRFLVVGDTPTSAYQATARVFIKRIK